MRFLLLSTYKELFPQYHNHKNEQVLDFLNLVHEHGRDNARTPVQWDSSDNGGFSTGAPWINANPNYKYINVIADKASENSIFDFYKSLLQDVLYLLYQIFFCTFYLYQF